MKVAVQPTSRKYRDDDKSSYKECAKMVIIGKWPDFRQNLEIKMPIEGFINYANTYTVNFNAERQRSFST